MLRVSSDVTIAIMETLIIKKERVGPVKGFHPWVFSKAIKHIPEDLSSGEPVRLTDPENRFLAHGYFNANSQMAVRIWSYEDDEKIDREFFKRRVLSAYEIRKRFVESVETDSYRLINGEGDLIPGLIVDKYSGWLVLQFHTEGIARWKDEITEALMEVMNPDGIYERSDSAQRGRSEGNSGPIHGEAPTHVEIVENGIRSLVDIKGGQKTGFFLDQRDKRFALRKYSKDKRVLNTFSYSGGFSLSALKAGASHVVSVDSSGPALELARENVRLNGFDEDKCEFIEADVKQYLKQEDVLKNPFGVIVLDPPAFIKDRHKKIKGVRGYRFINEAAMPLLDDNGILMTCSCSAHLSQEEFRYMVSESGGRASRRLQLLESFGHGLDHPVGVAFTEGQYLKCLILRASQ
jgi:23S rRNA (cytosine1962-C5)-methyltransferase